MEGDIAANVKLHALSDDKKYEIIPCSIGYDSSPLFKEMLPIYHHLIWIKLAYSKCLSATADEHTFCIRTYHSCACRDPSFPQKKINKNLGWSTKPIQNSQMGPDQESW